MKIKNILMSCLLLTSLVGCDTDTDNAKMIAESVKSNLLQVEQNYQLTKEHATLPEKKGMYENLMLVAIDKTVAENKGLNAINDMANQFKKDTTTEGIVFKSIEETYKEIVSDPMYNKVKSGNVTGEDLGKVLNYQQEVTNALQTVSPKGFDDKFIDYVNTLAAVSTSVSPVVVSELNKEASAVSSFIGNPQYGEWKTNDNGDMVWDFFMAYMFMNAIGDIAEAKYKYGNNYNYGRYNDYYNKKKEENRYGYSGYYGGGSSYNSKYRYDNWNNTRNWSYHNDKYMKDYAKTSDIQKQVVTHNNAAKKYSTNLFSNKALEKQTSQIAKTNKAYSSNLFGNQNTKNNKISNGYKNTANTKSTRSSVSSKGGK